MSCFIFSKSIYIRINKPTLNRKVGKNNHPHIWDRVLLTIPDNKINNQEEQWESQFYNTLVPSAPRRSTVEENIFCDTFTPRIIYGITLLVDLIGRLQLVNESKLFCNIRTLKNLCSYLQELVVMAEKFSSNY